MTPQILHEDKHIIVCIKPAGTPTQTQHTATPDMVSILKNHIHNAAPTPKPPYLAVIHRLDQPVEGLLVFAKTPAAAKSLNRQLTHQSFGKHYRALLTGTPPIPEGTLENYLIKNGRTNLSAVCSPSTPGAKPARLHYKITASTKTHSIADITLDTGRHHQIRVQLAHLGHPIAGDRKYGHPDSYSQLQLYATRLTFHHPQTNTPMTFQIDRLVC